MYHYKARVYSPTLGRFLQTDPIGYQDQINLYAYVENDPVNANDPSGEWTCKQGSEQACKTFSAALKGLKGLMNSQSTLAERMDVRQSINAYGREGINNGVVIASDNISEGASTNTSNGVTTVTFNSNWFSSRSYFGMTKVMGGSFSSIVAHEGRHVFDHRSLFGISNPRNSQEHYDTERRGYFVQTQIMRAQGWGGSLWQHGTTERQMNLNARERAWRACQRSRFKTDCSEIDAW